MCTHPSVQLQDSSQDPALPGGYGSNRSQIASEPPRVSMGEGICNNSAKKKLVLDLFSGTHSVGKVMQRK